MAALVPDAHRDDLRPLGLLIHCGSVLALNAVMALKSHITSRGQLVQIHCYYGLNALVALKPSWRQGLRDRDSYF